MSILIPTPSLRSRRRREREREDRRHTRRLREAVQAAQSESEPMPAVGDDVAQWIDEHVRFPHAETGEPVSPITPMGAAYLRDRAAFRVDGHGRPVAGHDIAIKPRQAAMTSLILGCLIWAMCRWDRWACATYLQVGTAALLRPLRRRWEWVWSQPEIADYAGGMSTAGGIYRLRNGSTWLAETGGATEQTASTRARSTSLDGVHLSDTRGMRHAAQLYSATRRAGQGSQIMSVSETTAPSSATHWHYEEWLRTREGRGQFDRSHFWAWWIDPLNRLARGSAQYERVMDPEWTHSTDPDRAARALAEEREVVERAGLDDEQVAHRRAEYYQGDARARREARYDYPEDPETLYLYGRDRWLDAGALEVLDVRSRPPDEMRRFGGLRARIWRPEERPRQVIVGADNNVQGESAEELVRRGLTPEQIAEARAGERADPKAAVVLDPHTRSMLAEVTGRDLDDEMAQAICWVLEQLVGHGSDRMLRSRDYDLVIERNRGRGIGRQCRAHGLRLWRPPDATGSTWGITTSRWNRYSYYDRILEAVEGPGVDQWGDPREPMPVWDLPSGLLVEQLGQIVEEDGRPEVESGPDDLVMALGIALHVLAEGGVRMRSARSSVRAEDVAGMTRAARGDRIIR